MVARMVDQWAGLTTAHLDLRWVSHLAVCWAVQMVRHSVVQMADRSAGQTAGQMECRWVHLTADLLVEQLVHH